MIDVPLIDFPLLGKDLCSSVPIRDQSNRSGLVLEYQTCRDWVRDTIVASHKHITLYNEILTIIPKSITAR